MRRLAKRIDGWRNPPVSFASPEAEADYKARLDRIIAAINLEKPDRVPVNLNTGFWPAKSAGMTPYQSMADPAAATKAWIDFNLEFQPDAMSDPVHYTMPHSVFEQLEYNLYSWPGHGVPKESGYQYNEKEWMLPEEYGDLISDPTDYMLRTYLPRTVGAFAGFKDLSSLFDFIELPFVAGHVGGWGSPEMLAGLERLTGAARDLNRWWEGTALPIMGQLMASGFPAYSQLRIQGTVRHPR